MKILVIPSSYPNFYNQNSAPFYRDQALALKTVGNDVMVLAVSMISLKQIVKKKHLNFSLKHFVDEGIDTWQICIPSIPKLRWVNNKIRTIIGLKIYNEKIKNHFKPDIIHVHSFLAGGIAYAIEEGDNIPYVITEHSSNFLRDSLGYSYKKIAHKAFSNAKNRYAVSEQFAKKLTDKYSFMFEYVPNVVPFDEINIVKNIDKNDKNIIRICNVANLNTNKRHDRLLIAFQSVTRQFKNIELHIAGDGPTRNKIKAIAKELGVDDKVVFHGRLNRIEVFRLMKTCDIFALSSDHETFGVVLIEAMACGLPVLATKCGGPESIVVNDKLGILSEIDDISYEMNLREIINKYNQNYYEALYIKKYIQNTFSYNSVGLVLTNKFLSVI